MIVFVDELDRCRPDYAISYLETIKHVFDTEGMVFILEVDFPQLASSAKALFGSELDVAEYFRKFCHRCFDLPPVTKDGHLRSSRQYVHKYLKVEGKRHSRLELSPGLERKIVELVFAFKMRPRQVQEAFRIVGHTLHTLDDKRSGKILFGYALGTVLLSCMRVSCTNLFKEFSTGGSDPLPICRELIGLMGKKEAL